MGGKGGTDRRGPDEARAGSDETVRPGVEEVALVSGRLRTHRIQWWCRGAGQRALRKVVADGPRPQINAGSTIVASA